MSLPNYLSKIKSSGIYHFVWDKSIVPAQQAETLRLIVGYSEKGPFNTPVYIDNINDFINIFGRPSKRLEKKGIFFHRMAIQALAAGPILVLNLKDFGSESVNAITFNGNLGDQKTKTYIKFTVPAEYATPFNDATTGTITITGAFGSDIASLESADKKNIADTINGATWFKKGTIIEVPYTTGGETVYAKFEVLADVKEPKTKTNNTLATKPVWDVNVLKLGSIPSGTVVTDVAIDGVTVPATKELPARLYFSIGTSYATNTITVKNLYDTSRFWKLDEDTLPSKLTNSYYYTIAATDTKDTSCTLFIRKANVTGYDITIGEWYASYFPEEELPEYLVNIKDTKLEDYFADIYVFRGEVTDDTVSSGSAFGYFDENGDWVGYFMSGLALNSNYKNALGIAEDPLDAFANNTASNFIAKYQGCTIPYFKDANGNYISLDLLFNSGYDSHKMLMKMDESKLEATESGIEDLLKFTDGNIYHTYLEGYSYSAPEDLVTSSLNTINNNKGLYTALTNNVDVQYHYIIDTYQSKAGESGIKSKLAVLAKDKGNAFAILNFPPMNEVLKVAGVNGDITKVPNHVTLASEQNGASYCAYYTQLKFSDGTVKSIIPSAALVSNLFMDKWGARQPYYVVAGPNYGLINYDQLVGPDFNYGRKELDILEPMGVNAIIYVPRKGTYINSNQTAKQNPVSALSKIHIRELVIYLQDEVEAMLQNYQWELNTATLRSTVKAKADAILEKVQNNGGVYAYRNICDETNNTPEVIDNEMIILDTEIEPARAAGKMVFRLKIHKTGGLIAE